MKVWTDLYSADTMTNGEWTKEKLLAQTGIDAPGGAWLPSYNICKYIVPRTRIQLNRSFAKLHKIEFLKELSYCYNDNHKGSMHLFPHQSTSLLRVGSLIYLSITDKTT
jgi:hypothetical protein